MSKDTVDGEPKRKAGWKKPLVLLLGALILLGGGAGAGLYFGGFLTPHKTEKADDPDRPKLVKRSDAAEDISGGSEGGEAKPAPRIGTVSVTSDRVRIDPRKYQAAYLALPENFTSNLSNGDGFVQVSLSVATYYDDRVFANVKRHMVPIRSAILMLLSTQDESILSTPSGKAHLQKILTAAINKVLREKEGFGGIDNVYFSNLVIQ